MSPFSESTELAYCTLKMEVARSSETSVTIYDPTSHHILEYFNLYQRH
jgi:hypothetical protein